MPIQAARRGDPITDLLIGEPLPQRLRVPKKYQAAVGKLMDHPGAKNGNHSIGRYLRYYLIVNPGAWRAAIADAKDILDDKYPWDDFGFGVDDEGHLTGPEGLIVDYDYSLLDPRGDCTLDPSASAEVWYESDAFGEAAPIRRRHDLDIVVTVLGRSNESLMKGLTDNYVGWNLKKVGPAKQKPHLELTHGSFSGRAELTESEPGVLICRIVPTDTYDPERLLALVMGALHRWLQNKMHSMTVHYLENLERKTSNRGKQVVARKRISQTAMAKPRKA